MQSLEDLFLFYCIQYEDDQGNIITEELARDGVNVQVTEINDYIEKRIEFLIKKNIVFVNELRKSMFSVSFSIDPDHS